MIVLINDKTYNMPRKKAELMMKEIKKNFKGTNTLLGIEKDNVLHCMNTSYKTSKSLLNAVQDYIKLGYVVFYSSKLF